MAQLNNSLNLKELSMGMSSDYLDAIEYNQLYKSSSKFLAIDLKVF